MKYFATLRSALHLTLVSKPIVSSRMYKTLSAVSKRMSGRKESPVLHLEMEMMEGLGTELLPLNTAMQMPQNLKQSCGAKYTYPPQDIPCIQQRHVVMILGASRKSNLMFAKVSTRESFYKLQVCCS